VHAEGEHTPGVAIVNRLEGGVVAGTNIGYEAIISLRRR
jgi:hypothetical protein